ncbi:MAG: DNA alkylation repair protein [Bacteroidales bacterium]|nr:DNA alkylation repair protein [Bacteroidales bacterium]
MTKQLKNIFFTISSINVMGDVIKRFYSGFEKEKFINLVFDSEWESRELKEKMHHTTICLHKTLPKSYAKAIDILKKSVPYIKGFDALTLPDYVELYGMNDWNLSLKALVCFTKFSTSEFAIRPFLDKDPERVMKLMNIWAEDNDHNIRRFASEGCRPRLPWAMALPKFKKDPSLILPILEKLKNDESEYVRRSVANNLNDISKDYPELVIQICEKWYGHKKNTDSIVKHACRSMLKAGNKRALMLFGFCNPIHIDVKNLKLSKKELFIGENFNFTFELEVNSEKQTKIRLEYIINYAKANNKSSKKVFQITENSYTKGKYKISKKHSFRNMTTRKHYDGVHHISIIVNGVEKAKTSFYLQKN